MNNLRRYIYAVYNRQGKCLYVGNSERPHIRMLALSKTGARRNQKPIKYFRGMILRAVRGWRKSLRIEGQVIRAYHRRGEARSNKNENPKGLPGTARWLWLRQTRRTFNGKK